MAKASKNVLGAWAFLIGVILALVVGVIPSLDATSGTLAIALVLLGIVIGLLNVGGAELKEFMIAGTALVIVSGFGGQSYLGILPYVGDILQALIVLFVPATVIVTLKVVFALAKK